MRLIPLAAILTISISCSEQDNDYYEVYKTPLNVLLENNRAYVNKPIHTVGHLYFDLVEKKNKLYYSPFNISPENKDFIVISNKPGKSENCNRKEVIIDGFLIEKEDDYFIEVSYAYDFSDQMCF